jgi:bifunctional ADP-heptose synthase (sugar kinase/adenylyltransferase)
MAGVRQLRTWFDENTPLELNELQPDILVKGGDYRHGHAG